MPIRTQPASFRPSVGPDRRTRSVIRRSLPIALQVIAACATCLGLDVTPALGGPVRRGVDDLTVTTWNENDGLSASRLTAIEQDQDGYLWIGTDVGVMRFDGVRFQPLNKLGETRLPDSPVTTLLSASDRSLWVGIG